MITGKYIKLLLIAVNIIAVIVTMGSLICNGVLFDDIGLFCLAPFFALISSTLATLIYMIPSMICISRGATNGKVVFWVNLLLGWTFIVWVITFIMSLSGKSIQDEAREAKFAGQYFAAGLGNAPSQADELAKMAELREKGILTDEEFQKQKSALIENT